MIKEAGWLPFLGQSFCWLQWALPWNKDSRTCTRRTFRY